MDRRRAHVGVDLGVRRPALARRRGGGRECGRRRWGSCASSAPRTPIGLNYRFETTRVEAGAVYFCSGYGVCDAPTIAALGRTQRLAPIGVSGWIDRSDDLDSPTRGYTARGRRRARVAATGSTFAHERAAADVSYYKPFGTIPPDYGATKPPKVLALHARAGIVRPLDERPRGARRHRRRRGSAAPTRALLRGRHAVGARLRRERARTARAPGAARVAARRGMHRSRRSLSGRAIRRACRTTSCSRARPAAAASSRGASSCACRSRRTLSGVAFVDGAYVGTSGLVDRREGEGRGDARRRVPLPLAARRAAARLRAAPGGERVVAGGRRRSPTRAGTSRSFG